jgi:outer membrane cobalamin receptor
LRLEKYFNLSEELYPLLGLSFIPKNFKAVSISTSWGKAVRYPDFNSLFWKGDAQAKGNPDLLPERKTFWNFGFRYSPSFPLLPKLGLYFYSEKIEDLIFWQRTTRGIWQPQNEANVKQIGWDLQIEQNLFRNYFGLKIAYSFVDAVNLSEEINRQDKRIIFIPEHSINSSLSLDLYHFNSLLIHRYVSEREITPANTGVPLDAYHIWDFLISYQYLTGKFHIDLDFAVKNIIETSYELLRGYPMPGRSYLLTVSLKYSEVN